MELIGTALKLWLMNVLIINCSSAMIPFKDHYQTLIGGQGLYNASDDVVILNATNFKTNIYGSTKSWLVEFYNSWCGFCYRFAPTWKALASDILSWNDIVVVAAIDCADDDNNPICREYEIMHYPMLKYFSVNAHPPSLGLVIEKGSSIDSVRHNLISRLEIEQQEGRGSTWPNITPYRNVEITDVWRTTSNNVKYFFFIFENTDSHLGTEVILDLHRISSLQIRRVTSDNELLCVVNKVTKFPTLIVFGRNESQKVVNVKVSSRQGVRRAIKDYVIAKGINIDETIGTTVSHDMAQNVENAHQTTIGTIVKSREEQEGEEHLSKKTDDYLYQLDLENALHYSMNNEISLTKSIDGEKMEALRKYLTVLAAYFPLRRGNTYLEVIRDVVKSRSTMTGEEFSQLAKTTEEEMSPVYSGAPHQWIGCKGSTNSYRGYPCGLWTMFHMLTVNFALEPNKVPRADLSQDPTAVLRAMHGYIGTFFGCADCVAHFVEMAGKNKIFDTHSRDEAVLWLWRAHNQVNARLSGDTTEDPKHKKIQYPAIEHCPACRYVNGSWNEEEVLQYLKTKYSYSSIKYDGISGYNSNVGMINIGNGSRVRLERLAKEKRITAFGWDLNVFDISICVVLYVTSAAILVLVCIKFAVKRTKKKSHISLLPKV
ncbi:Sulfhydryl oxidase [Camponotus japonicus]